MADRDGGAPRSRPCRERAPAPGPRGRAREAARRPSSWRPSASGFYARPAIWYFPGHAASRVGTSGLSVSVIGLGSWLTLGQRVGQKETTAIVRKALSLGVTFIDTADVYGRGAAETALGAALEGVDRDHYVLATKCFFPMTDHPLRQGPRPQARPRLDRPQPETAPDRPRRPLPVPPVRSRDADRGARAHDGRPRHGGKDPPLGRELLDRGPDRRRLPRRARGAAASRRSATSRPTTCSSGTSRPK